MKSWLGIKFDEDPDLCWNYTPREKWQKKNKRRKPGSIRHVNDNKWTQGGHMGEGSHLQITHYIDHLFAVFHC